MPSIQTRQWNQMVSCLTHRTDQPVINSCPYVEAYLLEGQRVVGTQQFKAKKPSSEGSTELSAVQTAR